MRAENPANFGSLSITLPVSMEGHGWTSIAAVSGNPAITINAFASPKPTAASGRSIQVGDARHQLMELIDGRLGQIRDVEVVWTVRPRQAKYFSLAARGAGDAS